MNSEYSAGTVINIIRQCSQINSTIPWKPYRPQFSLFLGAGASQSSGVLLASTMVAEFRRQYADRNPGSRPEECVWFDKNSPYASLFEYLYPTPALRRDYIERLLEFASPSLGYMYAVRLLELNVFNTVLTTNFDDLLNESCYLFSADVRPMVCSHDASVRFARMTTSRPKILKLHGDFLYDNIRNSPRELESLEENMQDKVSQFADEFGLIVIGYSGSDRTVMDLLEKLLRKSSTFPQGVFWCVLKEEKLSPHLEKLTRHDRFHIVEVEGFDSFMAETHEAVSPKYHPVVANPYQALGSRMTRMLNSLPSGATNWKLHGVLKRDLIDLGMSLRDQEKMRTMPFPHNCLAIASIDEGNFLAASEHVRNQLEDKTSTVNACFDAFRIGVSILREFPDKGFGLKLVELLIDTGAIAMYPYGLLANERVVELIKCEELEAALRLLNEVHRVTGVEGNFAAINRAQILLRQEVKLDGQLKKRLDGLLGSGTVLEKYGSGIVVSKGKAAVDTILSSMDEEGRVDGVGLESIVGWPITKLLTDTQKNRLTKRLNKLPNR